MSLFALVCADLMFIAIAFFSMVYTVVYYHKLSVYLKRNHPQRMAELIRDAGLGIVIWNPVRTLIGMLREAANEDDQRVRLGLRYTAASVAAAIINGIVLHFISQRK